MLPSPLSSRSVFHLVPLIPNGGFSYLHFFTLYFTNLFIMVSSVTLLGRSPYTKYPPIFLTF